MADVITGHPSTTRRFRAGEGASSPTGVPAHAGGLAEPAPSARRPRSRGSAGSGGRGGRAPSGGVRRVPRKGGGGGGHLPFPQLTGEGGGDGGEGEGPRQVSARDAYRQARRAQQIAAKPFRATSRVLVVEWLVCLIVIGTKPYDKAAQQGQPASEGTIPQLLSVSIAFALLAAFGAAGVRQQRISNLFGGLMLAALIVKNHSNILSATASLVAVQAQESPVSGGPSLAPGELPPASPPVLGPPASSAAQNASNEAYYQSLTGSSLSPPVAGVSSQAALDQGLTNATGFTGWRGA